MAQRAIKWSLDALQDKIEIYSYWIQKNKSVEYPKKLEKLFDEVAEMASIFPETEENPIQKCSNTYYT